MSSTANPHEFQQVSLPAMPSLARPLLWSIRRELWEFRSVYLAPFVVAALVLISSVVYMAKTARQMRDVGAGAAQLQPPYNLAALFLMGITFLISLFYCLEAMQSERRDRSILFWKSLPISDVTTVLSKMSIPIVVLPSLAVVLTMVTHLVMLVLNSAILVGSGQSTEILWSQISLGQMWSMMAYHMLVLHGLWMAPVYAWLLLVSAWARRLAFLWAALPLVIIGVVEKVAFNTTHFVEWLGYRFGGAPGSNAYPGGPMAVHSWHQLHLSEALMSPGLWTGIAFAALCLFAAARTRRSRGPM